MPRAATASTTHASSTSSSSSFQWGGSNVPKRRDNFVHLKLRGGNKHRKPLKRGRTFINTSSQYRLKAKRGTLDQDSLDEQYDGARVLLAGDGDGDGDAAEDDDESCTASNMVADTTTPSAISDMPLEQVLMQYFQHSAFRQGQREAIERVLANQSTLLIIPTGGGKSLCYQVPALMLANRGLTLVICPLISLMQDQMRLMPACLKAQSLHSGQSVWLIRWPRATQRWRTHRQQTLSDCRIHKRHSSDTQWPGECVVHLARALTKPRLPCAVAKRSAGPRSTQAFATDQLCLHRRSTLCLAMVTQLSVCPVSNTLTGWLNG
jgi:hypothetical protein